MSGSSMGVITTEVKGVVGTSFTEGSLVTFDDAPGIGRVVEVKADHTRVAFFESPADAEVLAQWIPSDHVRPVELDTQAPLEREVGVKLFERWGSPSASFQIFPKCDAAQRCASWMRRREEGVELYNANAPGPSASPVVVSL